MMVYFEEKECGWIECPKTVAALTLCCGAATIHFTCDRQELEAMKDILSTILKQESPGEKATRKIIASMRRQWR